MATPVPIANPALTKPKSMNRAKRWSEEVEEVYRFQLAGYRDRHDYAARNGEAGIDWWPHGYVKKLKRPDGYFYYYNRARECADKDVNKCKMYVY
ncbi:meiosis-expressed gene 1 protein-like [Watersipora subatra]|uniref:meiosis-expressed gene 1 protein-like n=1 Tax=Watersipora subatra TaxID=2589382 RepID=UPI00355B1961